MKTLPGIIAFLCWTAVLTAAENVSFVRPVVPGSCFQCRIQTVQSARYSFRFPGQEDTVVKQDTVRAEFRGFLTVQEVNAEAPGLCDLVFGQVCSVISGENKSARRQ